MNDIQIEIVAKLSITVGGWGVLFCWGFSTTSCHLGITVLVHSGIYISVILFHTHCFIFAVVVNTSLQKYEMNYLWQLLCNSDFTSKQATIYCKVFSCKRKRYKPSCVIYTIEQHSISTLYNCNFVYLHNNYIIVYNNIIILLYCNIINYIIM